MCTHLLPSINSLPTLPTLPHPAAPPPTRVCAAVAAPTRGPGPAAVSVVQVGEQVAEGRSPAGAGGGTLVEM